LFSRQFSSAIAISGSNLASSFTGMIGAWSGLNGFLFESLTPEGKGVFLPVLLLTCNTASVAYLSAATALSVTPGGIDFCFSYRSSDSWVHAQADVTVSY
jgi:hypothetical protein